jgi:hypothetical protein
MDAGNSGVAQLAAPRAATASTATNSSGRGALN